MRGCLICVHLEPGFLAVIQRWPLFRSGGLEGFHCRKVPLTYVAVYNYTLSHEILLHLYDFLSWNRDYCEPLEEDGDDHTHFKVRELVPGTLAFTVHAKRTELVATTTFEVKSVGVPSATIINTVVVMGRG